MKFYDNLVDWLITRANRKYSLTTRIATTLFGVTLFMVGMPTLVYLAAIRLDGELLFKPLVAGLLSLPCFLTGLPWLNAAALWQLVYGKGTPVPAVPTKNFLQNGPYNYVRNPMILGFILYLLGWTFIFNRYGGFIATGVIIIILIAEVKFIEEIELEKRFKEAYQKYKKETPFILPRWPKKRA